MTSTSAVTVSPRKTGRANRRLLGEVDGAGPGQLGSEAGRDKAGRQHSVGDPPAERRAGCVALIQMGRIGVQADSGEQRDVHFSEGLADAGPVTDGDHADSPSSCSMASRTRSAPRPSTRVDPRSPRTRRPSCRDDAVAEPLRGMVHVEGRPAKTDDGAGGKQAVVPARLVVRYLDRRHRSGQAEQLPQRRPGGRDDQIGPQHVLSNVDDPRQLRHRPPPAGLGETGYDHLDLCLREGEPCCRRGHRRAPGRIGAPHQDKDAPRKLGQVR